GGALRHPAAGRPEAHLREKTGPVTTEKKREATAASLLLFLLVDGPALLDGLQHLDVLELFRGRFQGAAVQDDQVRQLSGLQAALLVLLKILVRPVDGHRPEGLLHRKPLVLAQDTALLGPAV